MTDYDTWAEEQLTKERNKNKKIHACRECGDKLTLEDEKTFNICRGCYSSKYKEATK